MSKQAAVFKDLTSLLAKTSGELAKFGNKFTLVEDRHTAQIAIVEPPKTKRGFDLLKREHFVHITVSGRSIHVDVYNDEAYALVKTVIRVIGIDKDVPVHVKHILTPA